VAPAVTPLLIGFTSLLIVISVLGYLSVRKVESVGFAVLDLEQQYAARLSLLLEMRLALSRLNNEARARKDADENGGLRPPFDLRLRTAREELNKLQPRLQRTSLSQSPQWEQFRRDLEDYIKVTEDARQYSLEGFASFRKVDTELDSLLKDSAGTEAEIQAKGRAIQESAVRQISILSLLALLVSVIVAAGTIWEIQKRFRQMLRSMNETRRERSFSNQMLQGMVSAVVAIDGRDRIRSVNQAFLKIFPGASIGAFVREKFSSDDAMKMLEVATTRRTNEAVYCGRWLLGERGHADSFDVYSSPLEIDGDQGIIVTLVDVTEAAESERVVRRNEALTAVGQATAQLAHEIRNPLGSIRLGVSMLRDNVNDDEDALRTIDLVERGIGHLNKLVVDVTQYSRGKPLERANVDLDDVLNHSLDLVADKIQEKSTKVEKRFREPGLHGVWDADQLCQVFVNLISNAVDASAAGAGVTLETSLVSGGANPQDGDSRSLARIVIADHGSGMDEATRARVFQPFFSTKKRGTGLGLAIVKQIVEQHEGQISVESEPGKGTRFTIDLPL
jgi:signal transduction histidine kinase